ncbi:MAG: hypothetical protein LBB67_05975 [Oscillospiraceae bacterium]|jgi:hypothetical protein|nr:hypothetical protein [Oscillospiraceae bacterium]
MKRHITKLIALCMALLMLGSAFSAAGFAAAEKAPKLQATPAPTEMLVRVKTAPAKPYFALGLEEPDLSGLVLTVRFNGETVDVPWDDNFTGIYLSTGKAPTKVSDDATITVLCETYYWDDAYGDVFVSGYCEVPMAAKSMLTDDIDKDEITVGTEKETSLDTSFGDDWVSVPRYYAFEADATALYTVKASNYPEAYTPFAYILSETGDLFAKTNDLRANFNAILEAGNKYVLVVDFYFEGEPPEEFPITLLITKEGIPALQADAAPVQTDVNTSISSYFKFVPTVTKDYFILVDAISQNSYYEGNDPYLTLLDENFEVIATNDDCGTYYYCSSVDIVQSAWLNLNARLLAQLTKDKTYYICASNFSSQLEEVAVSVETASLREDDSVFKMTYKDPVYFRDIFPDVRYDQVDISIRDESILGWGSVWQLSYDYWTGLPMFNYQNDFIATNIGRTVVTASVPGGPSVSRTVEVSYTFQQLLIIVFLFGWIWY